MISENKHWCEICKKYYHWLGIARHRTMHYEQKKRGELERPKNIKYDITKDITIK